MTIKTLLLLVSSSLLNKSSTAMIATHVKCRGGVYPRSTIQRVPVADDEVSWSTEVKEYDPPDYTAQSVIGKPWADLDIADPNFKPKWNSIDGNVSRVSYLGDYSIVNGRPLNPMGRTGIKGRGVLGRWGPNHAADPVVTRWKKTDGEISIEENSSRPILQFVAIKRRDTGEWALPGGMVDPGERVSAAAAREFQEEATNSLLMSQAEKEAWQAKFNKFFSGGDIIYKGYVDDPRNTDNSWMETVAYSFHDESGDTVGALQLHAGDDAVGVRWIDLDRQVQLYASHQAIVKAVAEKLNAHY
ncbi:ADP-ribose pyrophosphatase, mitochondrial [Plutella xylostella]|uniref:ADP-ribose pyrophosphatase, mitochondrial n=1 Tax=Plutella xylostella TaxID=51655 RepID=UPI002032C470|nr:ADP-ribose pyrophosphatase, mitochondrial [Plutella xylostella]